MCRHIISIYILLLISMIISQWPSFPTFTKSIWSHIEWILLISQCVLRMVCDIKPQLFYVNTKREVNEVFI